MGINNPIISMVQQRQRSYLPWLYIALAVCGNLQITNALGQFKNGRSVHGFLGEPSKISLNIRDNEPEDMWFGQKLDHFDANNDVTWKQVD